MHELGPETSLGVSLPTETVDAGAVGTPPLPTEPAHGSAGWATSVPPDHSPSPAIHGRPRRPSLRDRAAARCASSSRRRSSPRSSRPA